MKYVVSLLERFKTISSENREKSAIVCGENRMTYGEVDEMSDAIAAKLQKQGVKANDIVPIILPKDERAICAMLGILKSGGAFCVINPDYPQSRVDFIIEDTGAKHIIDENFLVDVNAEKPEEVFRHDDDLAVVVYTSGSTGNPKGVLNTYRALSYALRLGFEFEPEDKHLSIIPLSFIGGITEVMTILTEGMTFYIAPQPIIRDIDGIMEFIKENGITGAFIPPQLLKLFLSKADGLLRYILTGSEKINRTYSEKTIILNEYGASETCAAVCTFIIDKNYEITPIGKTQEGVHAYILDDELRQVADGEIGEICISGQVAKGYLNLPELTADRFVKNHFSDSEDEAVLYRTNDLGRKREDGNIEYIQRKDWMIKVRGFRVEPGEIESAIIKHGGATSAAAIGFTNANGETSIYAVYTAPSALSAESVREAIAKVLPDYMIPAFMEQIEKMPLNTNGKLDRTKLVPPKAANCQTEYTKPEGKREEELCAAFEGILDIEKVGALDDFVLLGGDSIAAVRLQAAQPGIGVEEILSLRTPRALAQLKTQTFTLPKAEEREKWPLTFTERQMIAEQQLRPDSIAYNIGMAIRMQGTLDVARLEGAVQALVNRHRILRSYYPETNGDFTHVICPDLKVEIKKISCKESEIEGKVQELNLPYNISKAPLFRIVLFETGKDSHVLYIGMHHSLMDGVSSEVMINDLLRLYEGESLPPLERDYLDWAVWQSENPDDEEGKKFFAEMFSDGMPEVEMPTRPTRPDRLPFVDTVLERQMDVNLIEQTARKYNTTVYKLLFAAASAVFGKYCAAEDIVLGAAMNGRSLPETGNMVGMFVNSVPVRVKPVGSLSFIEHVANVNAVLSEVKKHQTYPFESLVRDLQVERNPSRYPVYDVLINYLNAPAEMSAGELSVENFPLRRQALAMDMELEMFRSAKEIQFELSFSQKLYEPEVAENLLEQLVTTIERICASDDVLLLKDAVELPENQRRQIVESFAGQRHDVDMRVTVVDLFRAKAASTPDAPAVYSQDVCLTYSQLDKASDRLAAALYSRGLGKGKRAGIVVGRSYMMPLCALGVLKSGAAYLPLDPSYPAERLEYMAEDAGADLLIADRGLENSLPNFKGDILFTDEIDSFPEAETLPPAPQPDDLFVLLYTSGTTGKPKGVMIGHDNLVNFCAWYNRFYSATETDSVAAYASFGFDACLMDMYPVLVRGGAMHIILEEMRLDIEGINDYFNRHNVSLAFMTTQLGRQFVESMATENHSLKALSTGGETLVPIAPPDNFKFYNLYGPTECTIISTSFDVDKAYDRVPIGKPIDNMCAYVMDKYDRLAPVGVAGELGIAGLGVAKGYLNRPDATAEKFIKNPFTDDETYERVYRSGDVVRFLPSGDIDFVGRNDFQVKIRGFRVELTEIEGRIRDFEPIKDAAVIAGNAPGGGKCAVAYIVSDETIDVEEMADFIRKELPDYMVPAATMQLDKIPLNPNGKVDRRKLPEPVFGTSKAADGDSEPASGFRTDMEKSLADIVAKVLGHNEFDLTTDLMKVGLSSLSAIKLTTLVAKEYGISLDAAELMQDVSILSIENELTSELLAGKGQKKEADPEENIALALSSGEKILPSSISEDQLIKQVLAVTKNVLGQPSIKEDSNLTQYGLVSLSAIKLVTTLKKSFGVAPDVPRLLEGATAADIAKMLLEKEQEAPEIEEDETVLLGYPLSGSQMGVYLDWLKRPEALVYNIPGQIDLSSRIDADKLAKSVESLIDAHPVLKMHVSDSAGEIMQISDDEPAKVPVLAMSDDELKSHAAKFVRPFDLSKGPLYRANVIKSERGVTLLLDFHHIVFDGASFDMFLRELDSVYSGNEPQPEDLSAFSYAMKEYRRTEQNDWEKERAYFADLLKDFESASEIPADLPGTEPGVLSMAPRRINRSGLDEFCRTNGVTPAEALLAVSGYVVSRWTGSPYVSLSTISGGRSNVRLATSYGMFVHTLPIILESRADYSVLDYMQCARTAFRGSISNEEYPYVNIAGEYGFAPNIMYACELGVLTEYTIDGEKAKLLQLGENAPKFKISIHVEEYEGETYFVVQYDSALYSESLAKRIADTLGVAFENMMKTPNAKLSSISIVSQEQQLIIDGFSDTKGDVPCQLLHSMVEQWADRTPDAMALLAEEGEYTYAELDKEANRIANGLLKMNVKAEDCIAFMLPRTGLVLKTMLGILKAGCAYIPLDTSYPESRISQILEDSGARILICDGEDARFSAAVDVNKLYAEGDSNRPEVSVKPEQLAYLIYTSGSTGKPKGVMIEHRNITNYVTAHPQNRHIYALVNNAKRVLSITTVTFDMFLKESMASLCNGLTLIFAGEEAAHDPIKLAKLFEATNADAFNATPSRMMEYTALPELLSAIRKCKVVMAGAEKFPEALLQRLRGDNPGSMLIFNTYGPTETTVSCNSKELTSAASVNVGAPLLNVTESVMDLDGNQLPVGALGELWIGGAGVARGYVGLAEMNASQFVQFNGGRVYRSGDVARWNENGEIEILGRKDRQVKIRGLRIELGEIENALLNVRGIENAVIAVKEIQKNQHLCAYYVASEQLNPEDIKDELAVNLAGYMMPTAFMQLDKFPQTTSGKIDIKNLPEPMLFSVGEYTPPETSMEESFCEIFARILELDKVSVTDNFFDIGGSSLAVTRIVIEANNENLKGENGESVSYGDVFSNPTPRELAALLTGGGANVRPAGADDGFDYTAINQMLKENTLMALRSGEPRPLGTVLLTGATGFLGIHVLEAFLRNYTGKIYCPLRKGKSKSVEERLKGQLFYYFENDFEQDFETRLFAFEGDITNPASLASLPDDVDTIINCAANVSHFTKDDSILKVNTEGVHNLIALAKEKNARLVQISTASVSGFSVDGVPGKDIKMDETMLYFEQNVDNQYVYSKFLAERAVLEAATEGLDAKIMRVGNLMARNKDGEFQMNAASNSFLGRLRAFYATGGFPYSAYLYSSELAPIDDTADGILRLAQTPKECRIFHSYNSYNTYLGDIIEVMRKEGLKIDYMEDEEYSRILANAMKDKTKASYLTSVVAYQNMAGGKAAAPVPVSNDFTTEVLLRMNWRWTNTGSEYITRFVQGMIGMGYFDLM